MGVTMGKKKNKSKRDRVPNEYKVAVSSCNVQEKVTLEETSFDNPCCSASQSSDGYGIRCLLEKTIESRNSSLADPNSEVANAPNYIDLSKDGVICEEEEVIDLTETTANGVECEVNEPDVIDISEEEPNAKTEGEDVCVIAMYPKPWQRTSPLTKNIFNNRVEKLVQCKEKLVLKNLLMFKSKKGVSKLKRKYKRMLRLEANQKFMCNWSNKNRSNENLCGIGSNVYVKSPLPLPSSGLRPIIIDGNNVAYVHSNYHFSCKRLEICINYFKERGHKVTAFVPQFRMSSKTNDDPKLLKKLEKEGYVVLTPSKKIDGRKIVPYDDRFIVQTAVIKGGIIISRDNYKDLLSENPAWAETIKYRVLAFTWVDDVLMFPKDPLGEFGPKLEEFLRFH